MTSTEGAHDLPYAIPNLASSTRRSRRRCRSGSGARSGTRQWSSSRLLRRAAPAANRDPYSLRRTLLAKHPRHLAVLELRRRRRTGASRCPQVRPRHRAARVSFESYCAQVIRRRSGHRRARASRRLRESIAGGVRHPGLGRGGQGRERGDLRLSAALKQQITLARGSRARERNFTRSCLAHVRVARSSRRTSSRREGSTGVGEPGVPRSRRPLWQAISQATGKRHPARCRVRGCEPVRPGSIFLVACTPAIANEPDGKAAVQRPSTTSSCTRAAVAELSSRGRRRPAITNDSRRTARTSRGRSEQERPALLGVSPRAEWREGRTCRPAHRTGTCRQRSDADDLPRSHAETAVRAAKGSEADRGPGCGRALIHHVEDDALDRLGAGIRGRAQAIQTPRDLRRGDEDLGRRPARVSGLLGP